MTHLEKEKFKKWNIKQGEAKENSERKFVLLQNIAEKYGYPRFCNAGKNLKNILGDAEASNHDKSIALVYYADYVRNRQRFECLLELLKIF